MEKILSEILMEVRGIKSEISDMKSDIEQLNTRQDRMERKLDAVYEQTAHLTEFRTETIDKLNDTIENQKSLNEMYGEHEMEIRNLRRRPV